MKQTTKKGVVMVAVTALCELCNMIMGGWAFGFIGTLMGMASTALVAAVVATNTEWLTLEYERDRVRRIGIDIMNAGPPKFTPAPRDIHGGY